MAQGPKTAHAFQEAGRGRATFAVKQNLSDTTPLGKLTGFLIEGIPLQQENKAENRQVILGEGNT